ncbi:hypothetical protein B2G51_09985 [Leptospira santarosai]|nr:hypothetical protein B2G51_09985 [Leptospira santarosai]
MRSRELLLFITNLWKDCIKVLRRTLTPKLKTASLYNTFFANTDWNSYDFGHGVEIGNFTLMEYCSELYNRVSKILLQNEDWTQNEWYPIL